MSDDTVNSSVFLAERWEIFAKRSCLSVFVTLLVFLTAMRLAVTFVTRAKTEHTSITTPQNRT